MLSVMIMTGFAQQGEIIYRENVALVPGDTACFTSDFCMFYATLNNNCSFYLDVDCDNVSDFYLQGDFDVPLPSYCIINSIVQNGWNMQNRLYEDTDTISGFEHWFGREIVYPRGSQYSILAPSYDTTMMFQYGIRHSVTDSVGHVTDYYGWFEVEGHWSHTWIEVKGGKFRDTLTACIPRLAYCTIPDYPLRWGQTRLDEGVEETEDMPITIHPNPTSGMITIAGKSISEVEVVNVLGQTVIKKTCDGDNVTVDLSGQPAGVYIFIMDNNGKRCLKKVIKE